MKFSAAECFMTETLNCGISDLELLDEVFSNLAYEVSNPEEMARERFSLESMLFQTYFNIKEAIIGKLKEEDFLTNNFSKLKARELKEIKRKLEELEESVPSINSLASSFDSDIDQVIDFDKTIEKVTFDLVNYWLE